MKKGGKSGLCQPTYTRNLLERFGMQDCKSVGTPVDVNTKLTKATDEEEPTNQQLYQSAIGSLMYLCVSTRPDITYAVGSLAKLTSKLTNLHWITLKCVLCYLKGTIDYEIQYKKGESDDCVGFSDTDWAGDTDDWKSTSGYMFKMSGGAIAWRSKK